MSAQNHKTLPSPAAGRRGRARSPFCYYNGQQGAQNYIVNPFCWNQPPDNKKGKSKESDRQGRRRASREFGTGDPKRFTWTSSSGSIGGCQCRPYYWCEYCHQTCFTRRQAGAPTAPTVVQSPTTQSSEGCRGSSKILRPIHSCSLSQERVLQLIDDELYELYNPLVELCDLANTSVEVVPKVEGTAPKVPDAVYSVIYTLPDAVFTVEYAALIDQVPQQRLAVEVEPAPEVPASFLTSYCRRAFQACDRMTRFFVTQVIVLCAWLARPPPNRAQPVLGDQPNCQHCGPTRRWTRFGLLTSCLTVCWRLCDYYISGSKYTIHPALLLCYAGGCAYYAYSHLLQYRACLIHAAQEQANHLGTDVHFVLHNYQSLFMSSRTPDEIKSLKLRFASWLRSNHPNLTVAESSWHIAQSMLGALRLSQQQNDWGMELSSVLPEVWRAHQMSRTGRLESGQYLPSSN